MSKEKVFFTMDELSDYLRIPKSTLYQYSRTKKIPCVKIGRRLRFRKDSVDAWFKRQEEVKAK